MERWKKWKRPVETYVAPFKLEDIEVMERLEAARNPVAPTEYEAFSTRTLDVSQSTQLTFLE